MEKAAIGGRVPIPVEVEAGKDYWWCRCGLSKTQPFCDGSHTGTAFEPLPFTPTKSRTVYFCTCKTTTKAPLCDGSHTTLPPDDHRDLDGAPPPLDTRTW